ncbi:MAG: hypothetical protein R3230_03305 [Nitrosopumilaceae archaeon]|nr:hypothetical protein [Nitrosopumilaceae archaeon]
MRISQPLIIVGLFIIASGILFHLQGQSIVGPESSFMYDNPEWISYGQNIAIAGLIITSIGIVTRRAKKKLSK